MNTHGYGGAQPKTGDNATALDRHRGYSKTMAAAGSKTRTRHPHMSKHYQYEDVGSNESCCNELGQHKEASGSHSY